jgi:SLT domain-containing protein
MMIMPSSAARRMGKINVVNKIRHDTAPIRFIDIRGGSWLTIALLGVTRKGSIEQEQRRNGGRQESIPLTKIGTCC